LAASVTQVETVNTLLVSRCVYVPFENNLSSYPPGGTEIGTVKGHEPLARGLPGVLEQLTYIHSKDSVSGGVPGAYKPIQSVAEGVASPLHVTVAALPAATVAGLTVNALMPNVKAFDAPPPGFVTVICASPPLAMSLAGMEALSCVLLTKVVGRVAPFHRTTEPETKLLPFTVKVNAGPPTAAAAGDSDDNVGVVPDEDVRFTILATDGTPLLFRMNSMYGPGGARLPVGATTFRPPAAWVKVKRLNRSFMLNAWVTDGRPISVT
jgi:hypothetical protein